MRTQKDTRATLKRHLVSQFWDQLKHQNVAIMDCADWSVVTAAADTLS